jgi:hypothetical protein
VTRERLLHDPTTGKIWGTRCEGAIVEVTSGNAAKPKVQPKEFPGPDEAVAWAVKQEWSRLKKGFVLVNPAAEAGQPSMQRYIGGGYTGALMIAGCAGRVVTNRHQDEDASGAATDMLVLVGDDARTLHEWRPGKTDLAWSALPANDGTGFLIRFHSGIYLWPSDGSPAQRISDATVMSSPFLTTSNGHVAWHDSDHVTVMRLANRQRVLQLTRTPAMVGGHSRQMMGALSPNAAMLACCATPGEIEYIDIAQAETVRRHRSDFEMITKMEWSPDGRWLLALEQYGKWRLLCLDTATGACPSGWPNFADMTRADFALDADGKRLAILRRGQIILHDFADMREIRSFAIDHVVRTAHIAWTGDNAISVRTDYGCLSTYVI